MKGWSVACAALVTLLVALSPVRAQGVSGCESKDKRAADRGTRSMEPLARASKGSHLHYLTGDRTILALKVVLKGTGGG